MPGKQAEILNAHIERLLDALNIGRRTSRNGRAFIRDRIVAIPEVRGQVTYFLALHEIAHCVLHRSNRKPRLWEETEAWAWALDNAIVDPTPAAALAMYRRLGSYLSSYVAVNLRNGREVRKIPPAGDPAWKVFDLLADLAEIPADRRRHLSTVQAPF